MASVVPVDAFASELAAVLSSVRTEIKTGSRAAVKKSCSLAKKEVKANAQSIGLHEGKTLGRYVNGWAYTTKDEADGVTGEIGNADVPGLPHLIEKGHARVGGGRVAGREHIAPAADKAFKKFEDELGKVVSGL